MYRVLNMIRFPTVAIEFVIGLFKQVLALNCNSFQE